MLSIVNADLGEAVVHGLLFVGGRLLHLPLDLVKERLEIEPFRAFDHFLGGQLPPCAQPTRSSPSGSATRSSPACRINFTTISMKQSWSLGEWMARTIASSSDGERDFGRHTKVARSRAAVSPVAQSWRASSCCVLRRFASARRCVRLTP